MPPRPPSDNFAASLEGMIAGLTTSAEVARELATNIPTLTPLADLPAAQRALAHDFAARYMRMLADALATQADKVRRERNTLRR